MNSGLGCETERRGDSSSTDRKTGGGRASSQAHNGWRVLPYLPSKTHSFIRLFPVLSWMRAQHHAAPPDLPAILSGPGEQRSWALERLRD